MSIAYDTVQVARRVASAPSSLLNRIQKPALLNRLSKDDTYAKAPSGPYVSLY
jgi:THO complex subunit 4